MQLLYQMLGPLGPDEIEDDESILQEDDSNEGEDLEDTPDGDEDDE